MAQTMMHKGITVNHNGYVAIDTNLWTTQAQLSKKLGMRRNVINNRVMRYLKNGSIPDIYIDSLDIRLIPNVNNINELRGWQKKQ
jgi:hypothetical protein